MASLEPLTTVTSKRLYSLPYMAGCAYKVFEGCLGCTGDGSNNIGV